MARFYSTYAKLNTSSDYFDDMLTGAFDNTAFLDWLDTTEVEFNN